MIIFYLQDLTVMKTMPSSNGTLRCERYYDNKTYGRFFNDFEGIPGTAMFNLIIFVVSIRVFSFNMYFGIFMLNYNFVFKLNLFVNLFSVLFNCIHIFRHYLVLFWAIYFFFQVMVLIFSILRKSAWDYGRIALIERKEKRLKQMQIVCIHFKTLCLMFSFS